MGLAPCDVAWQTWDDFWKNTGIVAASNAGRAVNPVRRTFWIIIFLIGLVLTIWSVWLFFATYLGYPVTTSVTLESYTNVAFPGVSICNQNRVSCKSLNDSILDCANITSSKCIFNTTTLAVANTLQTEACAAPPAAPTSAPSSGSGSSSNNGGGNAGGRRKREPESYSEEELVHARQKRYAPGGHNIANVPSLESLGSQSSNAQTNYKFLNLYYSLTKTQRIAIGHQFTDMVVDCSFKQRDCLNSTNFMVTNTPNYGNCFTFNSELNTGDQYAGKRICSMTGPQFGLEMVINIDQGNYMTGGQTQQAGARLTVQDTPFNPLPDEFGSNVMPNTQTAFSIQEVNITRYPTPYTSNCTSDWTHTNYSSYLVNPNYNYSLAQCQRFCLQDSFESVCNCFVTTFLDDDSNKNGLKSCNMTSGAADYTCVNGVIEALDAGNRTCDCNVQCDQIEFNLQISQTTYPSMQYTNQLMKSFGFTSNGPGPSMSENMLQVQIYFSSLNVQRVSESPTYQWTDGSFFSALGGALSLYLGIALAMIFEIIELFIDFGVNLCRYGKKGGGPGNGNAIRNVASAKSIMYNK